MNDFVLISPNLGFFSINVLCCALEPFWSKMKNYQKLISILMNVKNDFLKQ